MRAAWESCTLHANSASSVSYAALSPLACTKRTLCARAVRGQQQHSRERAFFDGLRAARRFCTATQQSAACSGGKFSRQRVVLPKKDVRRACGQVLKDDECTRHQVTELSRSWFMPNATHRNSRSVHARTACSSSQPHRPAHVLMSARRRIGWASPAQQRLPGRQPLAQAPSSEGRPDVPVGRSSIWHRSKALLAVARSA